MSCSNTPPRHRCSTSAAARGCSSIAGPYGSARACAWSASTCRRSRSRRGGRRGARPTSSTAPWTPRAFPSSPTSSISRARSRCWSTFPSPSARSRRWHAAPGATCSSRFRASPSGARSTSRAAHTSGSWATPRVISITSPSAPSSDCSRATGMWSRCARRCRGRCCLSASSAPQPRARSYGRGARILSVGIASTGALTLAYFSTSSHVLGEAATSRIALLWSVMFVLISVIYRPIEQLLSRTIAERRARGHAEHPLRVPIAIQAGFALAFLLIALALHDQLLDNVFDRYEALYDVLVFGTLAYAASYFARGWLAGHEYFALYGGLVLMESLSRLCFALAVAVGLASGQTAVAMGIAAAPLVSLVAVPAAFAQRGGERRAGGAAPLQTRGPDQA